VDVDRAASRRIAWLKPPRQQGDSIMNALTNDTRLLGYYEALERASNDMLAAARAANWDQVVKLEGACVLLIAQLKHAATEQNLAAEEARDKNRIMQRILVNDAEIRTLAEPWLEDLDQMLAGKARTLH
jgi:flagellar protein FliT